MAAERKTPAQILAFLLIAIAGVAFIALAGRPADKDFISYYAAGHLLVQHADPYDAAAVFATEKAAGYTDHAALIMRNPPWAMFLALPMGVLPPLAGLLVWTIAGLGCIFAFVRLEGIGADNALLPFLFAPAFASLCAGQSSPFLLLGFVLFLHLYRTRPVPAGLSLLLMAIKPHLFLLFWVVLLMDAVRTRRWKPVAALAGAIAVASGIALCLDAHIFADYMEMLHGAQMQQEFLPTPSEMLRLGIRPGSSWLLFLPTMLALAWAVFYYVRHRVEWEWRTHGMMLLMVTLLTSPYAWFSDQIVLLPAIALPLMASGPPRRFAVAALIGMNALILLIVLVLRPPLNSVVFCWTAVGWFAWFLYAQRKTPTAA